MPSGVFLFCAEPFSTKAIWPHNDTSNAFSPSNNFFYTWSLNYTPFVSESLLIFYDKKQVRFTNARTSGIYCITYPLLNTILVEILTLWGVNHSKNELIQKKWYHVVSSERMLWGNVSLYKRDQGWLSNFFALMKFLGQFIFK